MTDSVIPESPATAYSSVSFWDAYSTIYYSGTEHSDIVRSADTFLKLLLDSSIDEKYISVLCLGFGVGVFELPLLKQMTNLLKKDGTGKKIRLVAVDNCQEPLLAASELLKNGWENIPRTTRDFVSELNRFWPDTEKLKENGDTLEWKVDDHLFLVLDLDTGRTDRELNSVFETQSVAKRLGRTFLKDVPALWYSSLQESMARHYQGPPGMHFKFNLILASFIFQHLTYWQRAAVHSLALLQKDGILAFPQIVGDPCLFEGKAPPFRKNAQNEIAKNIFSLFYSHNSIKKYWQRQRTINASDPIAVKDFFHRLENESVQQLKPVFYDFQNSVPLRSYWKLLEKRGFSNLRKVDEEITPAKYDDHVNRIKKDIGEGSISEQDMLNIGIEWHVYRCQCPEELASLPLSQKYIGKKYRLSDASNFRREFSYGIFEYELFEATQLPVLPTDLPRDSLSFWDTLRRLATFGIFHMNCMGGVLGQSITNKPLRDVDCFLNPLWQSNLKDVFDQDRINFLVQVISYNILRKHLQSDYSNALMLLKKLLPKTPLPPVFTYRIKNSIDGLLDFKAKWHRNFFEISFLLNRDLLKERLGHSIGGSLSSDLNFPSDFYHTIAEVLEKQQRKESSPSYLCGVPEPNDIKSDTGWRWAEITHQFIMKLAEKERTSLLQNGRFRETLGPLGIFHPKLAKELETVLTKDMIATVLWTGLIRKWQMFVIFPETYWYRDNKEAEDAVILFYSKDLPPEELSHEYRKIELIYEQRGGRRIQERAEEAGQTSLRHSLPHLVSVTMSKLLELTDVIKHFVAGLNDKELESLPNKIKEINKQLPLELYVHCVQTALQQNRESETSFWKTIPHIDWIEEPIFKGEAGISVTFLEDLAKKIAYRWAMLHVERCYDSRVRLMAQNPGPDDIIVRGPSIFKEHHGLKDKRETGAFVTALIIILKEAIQHRHLYLNYLKIRSPNTENAIFVFTKIECGISIEISNPCLPTANMESIRGGNQEADLEFLGRHIQGWEIAVPTIEGNRWVRRLIRKWEGFNGFQETSRR